MTEDYNDLRTVVNEGTLDVLGSDDGNTWLKLLDSEYKLSYIDDYGLMCEVWPRFRFIKFRGPDGRELIKTQGLAKPEVA